ncbi:isocitrate lyase/PEP mutase family protein [Pseudoxanthomonas wuyuanensis]
MAFQPELTQQFRQLHAHGLLRLANAWDAGSARLIESLGAPAIATTSAGLAWSQGYADGDHLPVANLLTTVAAIRRVVRAPISIDIESGYSDDPQTVAALALQLAEAGVSGINLEDGAADPELLCAKIEHIRRACAGAGTDIFVNARTDVYLRQLAPTGEQVAATLARGNRYRDAGADGLFVPGLADSTSIGAIATGVALPLNVLMLPALPAAAELAALGVRRLSAGSTLAESAFGHLRDGALDFLQLPGQPRAERFALSYPQINRLFNA